MFKFNNFLKEENAAGVVEMSPAGGAAASKAP